MKKLLSALLTGGLFVSSASALPMVNGEISAGFIKQDIDGWVQYEGDKIDVDDDLNMGTENSFFLRAKLEHPIPLLPNIKLQYTKMRFEGDGTVSKDYKFGFITITASDRVKSKLELDHYDVVLFYNLPFINATQVFDAEVGLNVRIIDFYVWVRDETRNQEDEKSLVVPIPMLHGALTTKLPLIPVSLLVEASGIAYQGNHYYDIAGEIRYKPFRNLVADLFIGVGYKYEKIKIDDVDDTSADIKIKQPYFQVGLSF
ncbi:MAG: TIGR04219 family outer membrane beta-barrel protein [Aquificae bacterium]|nr:TIGR04219 family outer membrane beta-barrel protein [Aquificota bacterium]